MDRVIAEIVAVVFGSAIMGLLVGLILGTYLSV